MRCIAEQRCQVRINGRARYFRVGEIAEFDECPEFFRPLGDIVKKKKAESKSGIVDFDSVTRDELIEIDGDINDLKAFLKNRYPEVSFSANIGWDTLLFRYLEARESRSTVIDNTGSMKNTIVNVTAALEKEKADINQQDSNDNPSIDDLDDILGG